MTAELEVRHSRVTLGHLVEEDTGAWAFVYSPDFLADPIAGYCLSLALPPRTTPYRGADVSTFFRNLLPDGEVRRSLCHVLGLSEGNDFGLLAALGGDCPGALSLTEPGATQRELEGSSRLLSEQDFRNIVAALPEHPLLVGVEGARLSLPGEHLKVPLLIDDGQLAVSFGSTLSSHIAKPAKASLRESVMNEGYCLMLGRELGLPTVNARIRHGAVTALLVERVDRFRQDSSWRGLHMEDFCQLLGAAPEKKFEREGGLSALDCLNGIRRFSHRPALDVRAYLHWLIFAYLIGYSGGHAKQLAMLHLPEGPRLAPFYGLFSSHVYSKLNGRLAMSIGGEDRPDWLLPARWREFAQAARIRPRYLLDLLSSLSAKIPQASAVVAERFQRDNGYATIIRDIRSLIERRARQALVALEAEAG